MNNIKGIGIDIVSISRIRKLYELYKDKFLDRIFTKNEIEESIRKGHFISSIAGKFAAKEAFIKAYSSYLSFKQIEVLSSENGKPCINISNNKPTKELKNCFLSISHEQEIAIAVVVLIR